jgi:hypothetical protein
MLWNKQRKEGEDEREEKIIDVSSFPSTFCSSAVVNLNNVNPTANIPRRSINPHNPGHTHHLVPPANPTKLNKLSTFVTFQVIIPTK